jgi:hypothetical protein
MAALVISIVSALAAIAAAAFAFRSTSIASRALAIAKRQQELREASINPYLIDSLSQKEDEFEVVAFSMSYTNRSDIANTIVRLDLELHYVTDNGVVSHLVFPATPEIRPNFELGRLSPLQVPISIGPRGSISGWAMFEIPANARRGPTERYRVVATSALGDRVAQDSFLIRSVFSEGSRISG